MTKTCKPLIFCAAALLFVLHSASSVFACYAVFAGKDTTADGSVLFGHSEQNSGRRFLNFRVVPRIRHEPGSMVELKNGGLLPQVPETYSFIWSENFAAQGSDTYINEWGVACASNATHTKEDSVKEVTARGDIVDGGIGIMLRRSIVQRVKTAREGVILAGELIGRFGYNMSTGVTLTIADPNEAWILTMIRGKHWVAQRVPDDEVVILANVNIINEIDPEDTDNFLVSPDIIDYAIKRGWYDPSTGKPFNFKDAYHKTWKYEFHQTYGCDPRMWRGQCLVMGKEIKLPVKRNLPFSVRPNHKLTVADIRDIMSDHLEGTRFDKTDGYKKGSPHDLMTLVDGRICNQENQEVAVFQLRNWLPPELGCVYWRTTAASCSGVLTPWYLGITETPETFYLPIALEENLTLACHFNPPPGTMDYDPRFAFWVFNSLEKLVDLNYKKHIKKVRTVWEKYETEEYDMQPSVEEAALKLLKKDKALGRTFLTYYSHALAIRAVEMARNMVTRLRTELYGP